MTQPGARNPGATHLLRATVGGVVALTLLAVYLLVTEAVREFRALSSANSDNVHWALSQAEVEFLEFTDALDAARHVDAGAEALDRVVLEFDIFYSRMTTLGTGQLYTDLRREAGFGPPVAQIRAGLDAMIPVIDGPRDALRLQLPMLEEAAQSMRLPLRELATHGLAHFAIKSDASRAHVASTLMRLAALTVAMMLALLLALGRVWRVSRQTDRRGRELADAYARLNTILETSLDAVIVADLDGRILNFNPAAERTFGYRFEEVYHKSINELIVPEHLRAAHAEGMRRMRSEGKMHVVGQGRVRLEARRRDGTIFPVELALEKARAGGYEVIIGFLRDISPRVAAETELTEARDRALAGEKAKAEFLAMMTHEIRTPLNGLLGNLSLLRKTSLDSDQAHFTRNMDISGEILMSHVDAVLDVARFEAGVSPTRAETVHLGRLLQDIVDSQATAAQQRGNRIDWSWTGPEVDWVRLDAMRLRQVLLNLVGNAIKFTRDGRISIEVERSGSLDAAMIELRVIDTGPGISEADQARVFDDFFMVGGGPGLGEDGDATQDTSPSGTGLGLGIAQRFVSSMGGEIGVESTPGEGSLFWLHVPLIPAVPPEEDRAAATAARRMTAPLRVLLVEDNEINRDLTRHMLRDLGHDVTEACDGRAAVTLAEAQSFDLILMDIRMPVMDGLQATQAIRTGQGPNREVAIIAVSANVLPEARDRFVAAGMSAFLPKPLDPDDLARVVQRFAPSCGVPGDVAGKPAMGGGQGAAGLVERYTQEVEALLASFDDPDLPLSSLAEEAHRVAGSAAAFGQHDLRRALVAIENAAEAGDVDAVTSAQADARRAWNASPAPVLGL